MTGRPNGPVTVVIVHWNQPEWLAATLGHFRRQGVDVEFVVVDNDSIPTVRPRLEEVCRGNGADLVAAGCNRGFGPAANVGLRRWLRDGEGEWAVVAPHDARPDEGTVGAMIELIAREEREHGRRIGLACADVGDGHVPVIDPYFGGMTIPARVSEGWEPADYPHGTLMLLRRGCLAEVGCFDERYFAYGEEADLGLRAAAAGWETGLTRGIGVRNPSMRSGAPVVDYLMHRNTLLLVREWSGRYHATIRLMIALWQLGRGLVQPSSRGLLFSPRGRVWGVLDHLRGRYGPPPARLRVPPRPATPEEVDAAVPEPQPWLR